jgi:hypothetical protein
MIKTLLVIIAMTSLMFLIGCTAKEQTCTVTEKDGVKTYRNKNIPTVEKLDFNPVKEFTLNSDPDSENFLSFIDLDMIGADSKNNIYIGDMFKVGINKYDKFGNFVTKFCRKGTGPGEVDAVSFVCVKNDTIYIGDWGTSSISLFNDQGEFLNEVQPYGSLFQVKSVGVDKFVCSMFRDEIINGESMMRRESVLLNNSFQPIKVLDASLITHEGKTDEQDGWIHVTVSKDKIYLGANDKNIYKINSFDFNGKLVESITKSYMSINFTKKEKEKLNQYIIQMFNDNSGRRATVDKKHAVNGVFIDKNGNLLVHPAVDTTKGNTDGIVLDHFRNNIYLNTSKLMTNGEYYFNEYKVFLRFFNDRMYLIDSGKSIVDVYEY